MSLALAAMLVLLVVTVILGFPVGPALFGSSLLYFILKGRDASLASELALHGLFASFVLLAVPLFLFAARLMNEGGITDRLLALAMALVGGFRGGLAQVNVLASLIFASMSGSAMADAAGIGRVLIKMIRDSGSYSPGFAAAVTASSAAIGPIFPPSILVVFYAVASSTSVGALFLAGIVPGILIAVMLMLAVAVIARIRNYPTAARPNALLILTVAFRSLLPLLMPFILLGGIYSGAFTPTEAAGVACLYALLLCAVVYRTLGFRRLMDAAMDTARTTTVIATIFFGAFAFSYILTVERIPASLAALLQGMDVSAVMFLMVVNLVLLLLGAFLDATAIILVVVPLLMPTVHLLGIDPVHFGIMVTLNVTIGLVTPPFGMILFVVSSVNRIRMREILSEIWVLVLVLIACLFLITYLPGISLLLPRYYGFVQ